MPRIAGSKNKKTLQKMRVQQKDHSRMEITDDSIDVSLGATRRDNESSIPIGELKDRTAGLKPRSRGAMSREAQFRSKEEKIDYYSKAMMHTNLGKTYFPPECIPEGYVVMAARESCKGVMDPNNLRNLERVGWEYMEAEDAPQMAYQDYNGEINDSAGRIRGGGLIWMKRYKELQDQQLAYNDRLRKQQNQYQNRIRTINSELHPFATGAVDNNEHFFPSSPESNSFRNSF